MQYVLKKVSSFPGAVLNDLNTFILDQLSHQGGSKVFHRGGATKNFRIYICQSNLPLKAIACRRQEIFLKMASFEAKIQNELIPTLKASYFQVDEALKWKILQYYKGYS